MSKRLVDKLTIFLHHKSKFPKNKNHPDWFEAAMTWEDDWYKPREFKFELNANQGKRKQLLALAHEMVHVKQYARGEMVDDLTGAVRKWQGKFVKKGGTALGEYENYYDLPWEIEAHGREFGLYEMYKEKRRKK